MRIAIAGIKRSASTVQYNLVRIALEQAGYTVNGFGQSYDPNTPIKENEAHLIKIHPFRASVAKVSDHIFLTDRADDQILASLDRMWGSGDPERLPRLRKDFNKWKSQTYEGYLFQYEDWLNDPMGWVKTILWLLGVKGDAKAIMDEFEAIELPEDEQDPVTLFFPNHRTSV